MLRDLRHAARVLRHSPAYSLAVILTLALGIGATAAVVSVLRSVLLKPLPYASSDRVVVAMERDTAGQVRLPSYPTFQDWRRTATSFEGLAFVRGTNPIMKAGAGSERVLAAYASNDFFRVLVEPPLLGRALTADDFAPGAEGAVVLSYRLWKGRFAGDRNIVGRSLVVGDRSFVVVGVMPASYGYPPWAELFAPITAIADSDRALSQRGLHVDSRVVGRLKIGADTARARAELSSIAADLARTYPAENGGWGAASLYPVAYELLGDFAPQIRLLAVAACLVLLIACVNVANLSLARSAVRATELAVRAALGAGRSALLRLLAAEALLLGAAASGLGMLCGLWLTRWITVVAGDVLPRVDEIRLDVGVVLLVASLSLLVVVAFGVGPALGVKATSLVGDLRSAGGRVSRRLRGGLVVAEFALALVLLVGTGLLLRSLQRVQRVSPGFDVDRLLVIPIDPPSPRYEGLAASRALLHAMADAVSRVPGVRSVGLTNHVPLSGAGMPTRFEADGVPVDSSSAGEVLFREIDEKYLRTAGIPLLAGRGFTAEDMAHPGDAVLVNRTLAKRYWPGQDPVGRGVTFYRATQGQADFGQPVHATVAGVVGDVRHYGLEIDFTAEVCVPYTLTGRRAMTLLARMDPGAGDLSGTIRRAVLAVDPDIPLEGTYLRGGVYPVSDMLRDSLAYRRLVTGVLAAFALPALLLAALGIYGVVAFLVTQRTYEIAIRMALGANQRSVLRLVLKQGMVLAATGVAVGSLGALAVTRLLRSQLYDVTATDPASFAGAAALLILVGLLATYLPARRATLVAPMRALRAE